MNLSELTAYAEEKYNIVEDSLEASKGVSSVLCHPKTGKCIAVLMRHWDMDTGTEIQLCDLRCRGRQSVDGNKVFLSAPYCMNSRNWIGIRFDDSTEADVVFQLFDTAIESEQEFPYTITIASNMQPAGKKQEDKYYHDTLLPFSDSHYRPARMLVPKRIQQMRRMYEYGRESYSERAKNFYRQGMYMQDYVDDMPWTEEFFSYFPTYHDMNTNQLRGYFSWRTKVRNGVIEKISSSAVYIYLYELLNGIGCTSPEDSMQKMLAFYRHCKDSESIDIKVKNHLKTWITEFAVYHALPKGLLNDVLDPDKIQRDHAITVLQNPEAHTDEVFDALLRFGSISVLKSPVFVEKPEKGKAMFGFLWQLVSDSFRQDGKDLFELCFGKAVTSFWRPFSNAVYYYRDNVESADYSLTDTNQFQCRNNIWKQSDFEKRNIHAERINSFLRVADARLRLYYKTGRYLKERPADAWIIPYFDMAMKLLQKTEREAAFSNFKIDLSGLEKIRDDAVITQNSLLTEEEKLEAAELEVMTQDRSAESVSMPFHQTVSAILRILLDKGDPSEYIHQNHLTASLAADMINEVMFDEIGDNVLSVEDDRLSIVEDYQEDLISILGGT